MKNTFLEDFIESILDNHVGCAGFGDMNVDWSGIKEQINSLSENTCRLLEIGLVQDQLIKLGFEECPCALSSIGKFRFVSEKTYISIRFYREFISINDDEIYYDSLNWQNDLLNKVKGLMNEKS